jgi:pimeloyl-ACP methyl ester carboxylesterase
METVTHDGRETAYRLAGGTRSGAVADVSEVDNADVLYVHGSGGTHRVWGAQYGPGGPAHPAVALDLSGHGDSDDVETEHGQETLVAYARDVEIVAEATGADVLVGNSLGGAVCLHLAIETEFDPAGLVLAGTGAKLAVAEALRTWLAEDFERAVEFLHGPDRFFHDADPETVEHSKRAMAETGQAVTRRDFRTCHRFDVRDRLSEIDAPTLALVGEHDSLTPPAYHEYLAEHTGGEYAEIADAAHLAMVERPAAFSDRVGAFLDRALVDD